MTPQPTYSLPTRLADLTGRLVQWLNAPVSLAPLAVFRVLFGGMMLFGVVRIWALGWIGQQYIQPPMHFPFFGWEWVQPLGDPGMYWLFAAMGLGALGIMLGLFYRLSVLVFWATFTYVELIDITWYLNHYYFVSLMAAVLFFLPAHRRFSLDARQRPALRAEQGPRWAVLAPQMQLAMVYVFAGIAKLQPDWLLDAMPLRIWLPAHNHLPIIGPWMDDLWLAYVFSWGGALYDLTIVFFLCWGLTRPWAYAVVVFFHVFTWILFPIGLFPWIMILSTLIFFSPAWHTRLLGWLGERPFAPDTPPTEGFRLPVVRKAVAGLAVAYLIVQLWLPLRYLAFPGQLFWTEEGYRFSWRVMLTEKAGSIRFFVTDPATGRKGEAGHEDWVTPAQDKMLATQPDMILYMARHLRKVWQQKGIANPLITAECYLSFQGMPAVPYLDPTVDLASQPDNWGRIGWILPPPEARTSVALARTSE